MSEPRTETQDGPTTRKPQDTPFSEWTVLTADDVDGVTWYFHVPTAAVEREAATPPLDVRGDIDHAWRFINEALDKNRYGDAIESDLLEVHHALEEARARLTEQDGTGE